MYTRFIEVALIIVLFNAIRTAFNKDTTIPFIQLLAWMIFALSLFECSVALLQFISQGRIGLKSIGECDVQSYAYHMPNAHRWLFDTQKTHNFLIRASGTFPHPNIFGGFLFCALLNTFYLYFTHHKKKLLFLGILIQIPTLILTFSRAALIAFAFTTIFWFILQARSPEKRKPVLQLSLTLIGLAFLCLCLFYPQISARGGIVNYNKQVKGADTERMIYQKIALEMVKERPLLGVGLNNFQLESHRFFPEGRKYPSRVHNIYLLLAAETGLIGVGCFLLFLVSILRYARRVMGTQEGLFLLLLFSGFLFIGACDFYLFCTPHGQILFFGSAALLYVISLNERRIKLLVLIIASSDRPLYGELEKLWRSYMHLDPEHVKAYFLKADPTLSVDHQIIGDVCWSKSEATVKPGILRKTLTSMEALLPRIVKEYDYVLRTNLSSVYHFPRLLKFLQQLPRNRCYYGYVHYISKELVDLEQIPVSNAFSLAEGSGYILSPDVVSLLVEHKEEIWDKTWHFDDLVFGELLHRHGIVAQSSPRMSFTLDGEWKNTACISPRICSVSG